MAKNNADSTKNNQTKTNENFLKETKLKFGDVFETPGGKKFLVNRDGSIDEILSTKPDKKSNFKLHFKNDNNRRFEVDIFDYLVEMFGKKEAEEMLLNFMGVSTRVKDSVGDTYVGFDSSVCSALQSDLNQIFDASIINQKQLSAVKDLSNRRLSDIFDDFWMLF